MFGFNSNRERILELEDQLMLCKQAIGNLRKEVKELKATVRLMSTNKQPKALNKHSERSA